MVRLTYIFTRETCSQKVSEEYTGIFTKTHISRTVQLKHVVWRLFTPVSKRQLQVLSCDPKRHSNRDLGHCLGVVVHDLMCNADTALYTFGYYPDRDPIPRLKSGASRQCLKWDGFHQWATDRAPGYHPRLQAPANLLGKSDMKGGLQAVDMTPAYSRNDV
jgi:hypothetical protein